MHVFVAVRRAGFPRSERGLAVPATRLPRRRGRAAISFLSRGRVAVKARAHRNRNAQPQHCLPAPNNEPPTHRRGARSLLASKRRA